MNTVPESDPSEGPGEYEDKTSYIWVVPKDTARMKGETGKQSGKDKGEILID